MNRSNQSYVLSRRSLSWFATLAHTLMPQKAFSAEPGFRRWAQLPEQDRPAIRWPIDNSSADYLYLASERNSGTPFTLRLDSLMRMSELNSFDNVWSAPDEGSRLSYFLFGLRGCELVDGEANVSPAIALRESRPDHRNFKCVIGVARSDGILAAFPASTVPNADYIYLQCLNPGERLASLLPTGKYRYVVGVHRPSSPLPVPALILQQAVCVMRPEVNEFYGAQFDWNSRWDGPLNPGHNLVVAFGDRSRRYPLKFESAGTQVISGQFRDQSFSGSFLEFGRFLGLLDRQGASSSAKMGSTLTYILLTGKDARLACEGRTSKMPRVRFGSAGASIDEIRAKLELSTPGMINATVLKRILDWQKSRSLHQTGMLDITDQRIFIDSLPS